MTPIRQQYLKYYSQLVALHMKPKSFVRFCEDVWK